jgi:hypothetical protein
MTRISLIAAVVAACISAPVVAEPAPADNPYAKCPGRDVLKDATQASWTQKIDSALAKHEELRAAWKAPMPEGRTRVLVYWVGGDLQTNRTSVIAVREADGHWRTSQMGDSVVWIKGAKPSPIRLQERDLGPDESHRLDLVLNDPCLYAGPTFIGRPVVGGGISTLEIQTPKRQWRASWAGTLTPQERAILELIDTKG